ncbi:uracil-DNA glycosylase [Candidatus Babeliales bacterium]|nr:uracil-DNA glycosylase [Candidatus Babeliales bacterium]
MQPIKNKQAVLDALHQKYTNCQACPLATMGRTQVVFGVGDPNAQLMFIGEAPGFNEDQKGEPFIGRAGQLLTKIIEAMGLSRQTVYISNVVKCRPPNNRTPTTLERETCKNLLLVAQIAIIRPKIICTLGSPSTKALLGDDVQISLVRGKFFEYQEIPVMPTFHPAYLLRNPIEKRTVWEDMKKIMEKLKELE